MFFIFWYDYLLLPFYLIAVSLFMNSYFKRKHGYNPMLKKHFNRGLWLKILGCIAIGMVYEYYYRGAYDGRWYFDGGKMLANYWLKSPSQIIPVLIEDRMQFNQTNLLGLQLDDVTIFTDEAFFVSKIVGIVNIFSFNAFLPSSLIICSIAFIALWNLFIFLMKEQSLLPIIAGLCTIYIPSLLVWDSSIFKDTITFTALCWMFICGYYIFIKPRKLPSNILGFTISAYCIIMIKVYIIAAFAPFFILYIFNMYKNKINNPTLRKISTPFILLFSAGGILLFLRNASEMLGRYSVEQVLDTASRTAYDIAQLNAGSAYTINTDLSSIGGILKTLPAGIIVTLFRPFPWEYLKPIILFASAESMIILYFTIKVVRSLGLKKTFATISNSPILQFCLFFSLLFAFMVGITSTNFGTLVRYKIPVLPFYTLFLALLYKQSDLFKFNKSLNSRSVSNKPLRSKTII
jgi:hypothetical protein